MPISIDPAELKQLIEGTEAIHKALGGTKEILKEEQPTIDFAYACVVTIRDMKRGEVFAKDNIWVKRPGTGQIKAELYPDVLGKRAATDIPENAQVSWEMVEDE